MNIIIAKIRFNK